MFCVNSLDSCKSWSSNG